MKQVDDTSVSVYAFHSTYALLDEGMSAKSIFSPPSMATRKFVQNLVTGRVCNAPALQASFVKCCIRARVSLRWI